MTFIYIGKEDHKGKWYLYIDKETYILHLVQPWDFLTYLWRAQENKNTCYILCVSMLGGELLNQYTIAHLYGKFQVRQLWLWSFYHAWVEIFYKHRGENQYEYIHYKSGITNLNLMSVNLDVW
jgi:hypothetical protein